MRGEASGQNLPPVLLTASWRNLVMLNYKVDREVLVPFLPPGLEIDAWEGRTMVSVVGFEFADVRVLNRSVPLHRDFDEVNLRFYVRREMGDVWRRGVVFVRELVPLPTVALLARLVYGEPYRAVPMQRDFEDHPAPSRSPGTGTGEGATTVRYSWRHDGSGTGWR